MSPSIDIVYLVDTLTLGEIHRPTEVVRCAGGKSLNLARAARTQGAAVQLTGLFGGSTGSWLAEELAAAGVTVAAVPADAPTRTCVSIASAADGSLTEVYERAAAVSAETWQAFLARIDQMLVGHPGWLALSGSMPTGLPPESVVDLLELGHDRGVAVAVDTHGDGLRAAVTAGPDLIKVNRAEAAAFLAVPADTELAELAAGLRAAAGGAQVVLTDGAAGALAHDGTVTSAILPGVHGTYPVGSGDSFMGGLLTGLDAGHDLAESLRTGMACGTANALLPGPGRFDPDEVARLSELVELR
ncbi:1-phosphofructokinase family hexose kinase [Propionibacteriaceae bacterium Y2011]|uniref:1-phosphofructokinase family hexose kinase n=1 Tax=Microlunatus sp. Y2014 TaxID=3418488 RepID=UPI003B446A33